MTCIFFLDQQGSPILGSIDNQRNLAKQVWNITQKHVQEFQNLGLSQQKRITKADEITPASN
jgi:hypothetical protein